MQIAAAVVPPLLLVAVEAVAIDLEHVRRAHQHHLHRVQVVGVGRIEDGLLERQRPLHLLVEHVKVAAGLQRERRAGRERFRPPDLRQYEVRRDVQLRVAGAQLQYADAFAVGGGGGGEREYERDTSHGLEFEALTNKIKLFS